MDLQNEIHAATYEVCKLIIKKKPEFWTHSECEIVKNFIINAENIFEIKKHGATT